jgi:hypothetical protein
VDDLRVPEVETGIVLPCVAPVGAVPVVLDFCFLTPVRAADTSLDRIAGGTFTVRS